MNCGDLATITHTQPSKKSWLHNGITNPGLNKYKHHNRKWVTKLNPFTAVLTALSLWKWPVNAPDLKSLQPFVPFAWTRERVSIKIRCTDSRFVIGLSQYQINCLQACTCALFHPDILQAAAVKGLNSEKGTWQMGCRRWGGKAEPP